MSVAILCIYDFIVFLLLFYVGSVARIVCIKTLDGKFGMRCMYFPYFNHYSSLVGLSNMA